MIPHWHPSTGTLPTVRPGADGHSQDRSPYRCSFSELVERFATSPSRIEILLGLLSYRKALTVQGITEGFQWIDGSFVEDSERTRSRPPADIDVVTFFHTPADWDETTLVHLWELLFHPPSTKANFKVDAYPFTLGEPSDAEFVGQVSYWYSLWSHCRDRDLWKGFLRLELSSDQDAAAEQLLDQITVSVGGAV